MAMGKDRYVELLNQGDFDMATMFKQDYSDLLKQYYYVGGMPEVVQAFVDNHDFNEVREIQQRILSAYEQDLQRRTESLSMALSKRGPAPRNMSWPCSG